MKSSTALEAMYYVSEILSIMIKKKTADWSVIGGGGVARYGFDPGNVVVTLLFCKKPGSVAWFFSER